jgi:ParB family chromosome partitioning protein
MAAKAKLALTPPTSIPLDKLVLSDANVRRVNAAISIEALADSIARRGLLQSLSVRPVLDDDAKETGTYAVQAGGRRWRALKRLVKQKRLAKDAPIACIVKTTGIIEDDSLAENTDRVPLHPLDEFRAMAALRAKGLSIDDIAAARGCTPAVVRQRLKLASASPKLLDAYGADAINLEQLMAYCVTDDHARQEQVFEAIKRGQVHAGAHNIRRLLTEKYIEASDPRARFVGIDAYVAAGGRPPLRDLFQEDDGGWLDEPELLMRLVSEKLAVERERILAQGWKWADAALEHAYDVRRGLRRLRPIEEALSEDDEARQQALAEEYDTLVEGLSEDDIPDDVRARLDAIEAELAELESRPPKFPPEDMARGGVLISVNHEGRLQIEYGFLRPEDAAASALPSGDNADENGAAWPEGEDDRGVDDSTGHAGGEEPDDEAGGAKALPDRLVQDLTSFRTVALRNALADDYPAAFLAVLHALCLDLFYHYSSDSCLQIKANEHFPAGAAGLADMAAAKAIEQRHAHWQGKLPEDPRDLWAALVELERQGSLGALFAHCASLTVNAVRESHQPRRQALRHADTLAAALSLDMTAAGWTTTADNYLGRVTKAKILEAVREAKGEDTARLIEHLKKSDMAKEAQRLLEGTGWLPESLRTPPMETAPMETEAAATTLPALPDFLAEEGAGDEDAARLAAE